MEINTMYHVSGQTSQCYIKQLIPQINNIYHVSGQTSQCYIWQLTLQIYYISLFYMIGTSKNFRRIKYADKAKT